MAKDITQEVPEVDYKTLYEKQTAQLQEVIALCNYLQSRNDQLIVSNARMSEQIQSLQSK